MEKENKLKKFWNKINGKELIIILLIYAFSFLVYLFFAGLQRPAHTLVMKLDDYVPFIPVFVIAYYFYYFLWWASVWCTSFKNKNAFIRMCKVTLLSVVVCAVFYYFFPVAMRRPEITSHSFFPAMVQGIYKADINSITCFPSLHAVMGTVTAMAACKDKGGNIFRRIFFIFVGVTMTLSAVFIKQHYLVDIIAGTSLVILADLIFELIDIRLHKEEYDETI